MKDLRIIFNGLDSTKDEELYNDICTALTKSGYSFDDFTEPSDTEIILEPYAIKSDYDVSKPKNLKDVIDEILD